MSKKNQRQKRNAYWRSMRTQYATYKENEAITLYKERMMKMLHMNFPLLTELELSAAIDDSISKHAKDTDITVENNYKNKTVNTTMMGIVDYILTKEPIITSYGVLFSKHGTVPNPIYNLLQGFIDTRKSMKKEMFKYPKGSEDFEKYNLLQLLSKIDANGFYGAEGMYSCIFYNLYVASSITTQGRSCNSAAALFFESFLNNNVPMSSMNEVIEFIYNVLEDERNYDSSNIITNHASIDETFFQLLSTTGFGWVPSIDEMHIIWEILAKLSQDDLDRLFYKNNLFHFVDNEPVKMSILYILQQLKAPFMNPNDPPEEIIEPLKRLCSIFEEYVYYGHQIIDRLEKMDALIRSVNVLQDTDSVITSLDGWYQYVRNMCIGVPMAIKDLCVDSIELIDTGEVKAKEHKQVVLEYDFVNDTVIENDRLIDPFIIIPQDGLRYSIINIMAYCLGKLANEFMEEYCINSHSENNIQPCLISLKNEFLMKRLLLTMGKKHYASKIELQEGNIVPEDKSMDIKGLDAFIKCTSNEAIQDSLKKILYDDILNSREIDQVKILADIAKIEKDIIDSIQKGEKRFFKPARVNALSSYDNPMRIQGIVSSYMYNLLHEQGTEAIDLTIRNSVDIAKVNITLKNIHKIRDTHPTVYEKAVAILTNGLSDSQGNKIYDKKSIDAIAIPVNEPVPDWVLPFIEYDVIINDNIKGFPIEAVGLNRGPKTNVSTNIISF